MSSLAMSSFVEQQIVLHQFTAKHSVQARAMLGWSREDLALAFRLEAEGLVFFPGFAPGWGMSARRFETPPAEPTAQGVIARWMGSTTVSIDPPTPQPNGA